MPSTHSSGKMSPSRYPPLETESEFHVPAIPEERPPSRGTFFRDGSYRDRERRRWRRPRSTVEADLRKRCRHILRARVVPPYHPGPDAPHLVSSGPGRPPLPSGPRSFVKGATGSVASWSDRNSPLSPKSSNSCSFSGRTTHELARSCRSRPSKESPRTFTGLSQTSL